MTSVAIEGHRMLYPPPGVVTGAVAFGTASGIDAVGEIIAMIGYVQFTGGAGTSKTFSASGGKISTRIASLTWANAATVVRIGIQDVSAATGPVMQPDEDWTGETYADIDQPTFALTANTWTEFTMDTGAGRTLTHGDLIAVVFEMTARGGTDLFSLSGLSQLQSLQMPWQVLKTASYANTNWVSNLVIECDDGTLCNIAGGYPASAVTNRTFNTSTGTADEYGIRFVAPFSGSVDTIMVAIDMDGDCEFKIYSGAAATPTELASITLDANQRLATSGLRYYATLPAKVTITAGETYYITVRPTTTTSLTITEIGVSNTAHLQFYPGGDSCYKVTRLDDAGALTETNTATFSMSLGFCDIEDGAGVGGGGAVLGAPNLRGNMQ